MVESVVIVTEQSPVGKNSAADRTHAAHPVGTAAARQA